MEKRKTKTKAIACCFVVSRSVLQRRGRQPPEATRGSLPLTWHGYLLVKMPTKLIGLFYNPLVLLPGVTKFSLRGAQHHLPWEAWVQSCRSPGARYGARGAPQTADLRDRAPLFFPPGEGAWGSTEVDVNSPLILKGTGQSVAYS